MRRIAVGLLAATMLAAAPAAAASGNDKIIIVGAMIFDGTGAAPRPGSVLIEGDRIVRVGADLKPPRGARMIQAHGKALLPGFFDVHTHWTPAGAPATLPQIATAYVTSGVTTVNDFHEQPESFAPRRQWLKSLVAPHVNFAARISTPGGHGADWADQATTKWVSTPDAARAAVRSLAPYKPDLIKVFTDGWRYGTAPDNTSMDEWTLRALTDEAHKQGLEVLTHTVTIDRGVVAARAGVTALAHGLQDREIDAEAVALIAKSGMAMAPTLAVYDPHKFGNRDPNDPRYRQSFAKFGYALHNVKALYDAGVPIALGTDAGMTATPHGRSTLHEMELLVQAGLTPTQALVAGTATSAKVMHLEADRGTIAPGKRADLVLIDGKPWDNIADVYKVSQVLIDGKLVHGPGAPALPTVNRATRLPSVKVAALVDDFERTDGRTQFDTLRLDTPDGGIDRTVEITQVVPRDGGGHALALSARMAIKDSAYAGVAMPLTRGSVAPVDLRGYRGVRFEIKGQGAYRLTINGLDGSWAAPVEATSGWTSIEVPFTALQPRSDGKQSSPAWTGDGIVQVEVGADRGAGERIWFALDNVRFY